MIASDIPHRLKALREAAGLSIRATADLLGMSSSGYSHYETPARFKDQFLPMQIALDLARVLTPKGIRHDQVMALAGQASTAAPAAPAAGFSDNAAQPWSPAPQQRAAIEAVIGALAPQALNPGTFQMTRAIPELGFLPGDILIIDRKRLPEAGQLALANARLDSGSMATVIGRYLPPLLFTAESLTTGRILDVTTGAVAVYHPILASFRASTGPTPSA